MILVAFVLTFSLRSVALFINLSYNKYRNSILWSYPRGYIRDNKHFQAFNETKIF